MTDSEVPTTMVECRFCGEPIWRNDPSDEWFHESTGAKRCESLDGSPKAAPERGASKPAALSVEELEQISGRANRATPGPWVALDGGSFGHWWVTPDGNPSKPYICPVVQQGLPDADFIAHAREDVPRLLDALVAVQAENERLRTENKEHCEAWAELEESNP